MKKTIFDLMPGLAPVGTPEEQAAARAEGMTVAAYRAMKLIRQAEQERKAANRDAGMPDDVAAEADKAEQMRHEPGVFKRRNEAPNLLVQAAQTPGEVAKVILFVILYVIGMAALVIVGGERVRNMPGIFQCGLLALLIIPVWWLMNRIWYGIGEGARDFIRLLVRFWPVTLVLLVFVLGGLRLLLKGS
jgi:hypothetical protein